MTVEKKFTVSNRLGLHARAATKLVLLATKFPCDVELINEEQVANAKSVMGVLLLCGAKGTVLGVRATGDREAECVEAIGQLFDSGFGEES